MTKRTLDYTKKPKPITLEFIKSLDFDKVLYAERSQSGAMGVPGNAMLYALDNGELTLYQLVLNEENSKLWLKIQNYIADNEDKFDVFRGGFGNGALVKKNADIEIVHIKDEDKRHDSHFIFNTDNYACIVHSSVYGVFQNVADQLEKQQTNSIIDPLQGSWEARLKTKKADTDEPTEADVAEGKRLLSEFEDDKLKEKADAKHTHSVGAIIGDIIGSVYEFNNIKTKDFPLLTSDNFYTDDTVMTAGTMWALTKGGKPEDFIECYQELGHAHPHCGYGARFFTWLANKSTEPYNSFGNGSAMRVGPVAWFYDNLEDVESMAEVSASVTHNHPEGIKGAQATAAAIFMARDGASKEEIKRYIEKRFHYDLDFTLDEIRPTYEHVESCQESVPQAIVAFLEGKTFEDAIRNAISIGGDSDTIAAITGSIAEAFYGIPESLYTMVEKEYLTGDLAQIVKRFNRQLQHKQ